MPQQHDYDTKLKAMAHFASSNNVRETARSMNLPVSTIATWVHQEDGGAIVANVRTAMRHIVAADLIEVSKLAITNVKTRLQQGDSIYLANGEMVQRPVSAKDAMYIASNAISQHSLLTGDTKAQVSTNLQKLSDQLISEIRALDVTSRARDITQDSTVSVTSEGEQTKGKADDALVSAHLHADAQGKRQSSKPRAKAKRTGKGGGDCDE
jgi:hypothetical protein